MERRNSQFQVVEMQTKYKNFTTTANPIQKKQQKISKTRATQMREMVKATIFSNLDAAQLEHGSHRLPPFLVVKLIEGKSCRGRREGQAESEASEASCAERR